MIIVTMISMNSGAVFAGNINNLSNQSADALRSFSRNAATDAADAVTFNPAGCAKMDDGLYINFSNQFLIKNYSMDVQAADTSFNTEEYKTSLESDEPSLLLPNLYTVFKKDDWAAFAALNIPAGGGGVDYSSGVPFFVKLPALYGSTLTEGTSHFKASSMYIAGVFGGAYAINKIVTVSLSGRYVYGKKTYEGGATLTGGAAPGTHTLDAERTAHGFGGIIGLNVSPVETVNIGIRYETETAMNWKTKVNKMTLPYKSATNIPIGVLQQFEDGAKEKINLPSILAFGASWDITPELSISSSLTWYFVKLADKNSDVKVADATAPIVNTDIGYDDDYNDGFDLAFAVDYRIMPDLLLSAGYNYSKTGGNSDTYSDFECALDSHTVGIGAKYSMLDNLDLTFAFSSIFYVDGKVDWPVAMGGGKEVYKKQVYAIGLGAEYKIF